MVLFILKIAVLLSFLSFGIVSDIVYHIGRARK